jgi:hypothetical protein
MSTENNSSPFWGYIGKFGIVVALVWGVIQIYNYFFKTEDYEADTKGSHSFYETSPIHKTAYKNAIEYKALVKAIIEKNGTLKNYELDSLISKVKKGKDATLKSNFEYYKNQATNYSNDDTDNYNEIWFFTIKNTGHKPLEELALELPFEGSYKVVLPNNISKVNSFKNKVIVGELRPSYEVTIVCWSDSYSFYSIENEDLSRFTHKYGWFGINYPVQVDGIYAWNKKYNDFPLILIACVIGLLIFFLGVNAQYNHAKKQLEEKDKKSEETQPEIVENATNK